MLVAGWSRGGPAATALAVYGAILFVTPLFLQYLFNGLFQTRWAALGNAIRGLTFVAAVVLLVRPGASPAMVAVAELLGAGALALCNLVVFRRAFSLAIPVRDGRRGFVDLIGRSWSIGASEVVWGLHWYSGLVLLGYLATSQDAAWYSAGLRIVMALHTAVWLYHYVLLPNLAHLLATNEAAWRATVEESIRITGWLGLAVPLVGMLAGGTILRTVFGAPFVEARPALQTVLWIMPIAWLSGHIRYSLIAAQQPRRDYEAALIGAGTTVALTFLLIPGLGSLGAALGLVGGMVANGLAAWLMSRSVLPACAYVRPMARSSVTCGVCLALGLLLSIRMGETISTAIATTTFVSVALYAERASARTFVQSLFGSSKIKATPNADASA